MSQELAELRATLASDPHNRAAFRGLADGLREAGAWRDLVELYEGRPPSDADDGGFGELADALKTLAAETEEKRERGAILVALGDVYIDRLGQREEAMAAYQRSFKTNPRDTTCLRSRARDLRGVGRLGPRPRALRARGEGSQEDEAPPGARARPGEDGADRARALE